MMARKELCVGMAYLPKDSSERHFCHPLQAAYRETMTSATATP